MKGCCRVAVACGLVMQTVAAIDPALPSVTVLHQYNVAVRQAPDKVRIAAVVPTESGQIGINPPVNGPTPANIEAHTRYLKVEGGATKWIGTDPNNIAVKVTTTTNKAGATAVATITKGVSALKDADGGLNILLSPKVKGKLEAIAKLVKPCATRRRRSTRIHKREGPACGLADFVQRVGADPELQAEFAHPLTDQVWAEVGEGQHGDPAADQGWEGDGGHQLDSEGNTYFSDDKLGGFEGAKGPAGSAAGDSVEMIVISSAEEAAMIAEGFASKEAAVNTLIWGGSTVVAGSLLAFVWNPLKSGQPLAYAYKVPAGSIHKISRPKTKTTSPSSSASSTTNCPKATGAPPKCDQCKPTKVKAQGAKATDVVDWACSEGSTKGCPCNPVTENRITYSDKNFNQAVLEALSDLAKLPAENKEPGIRCDESGSAVTSEFLVEKTANGFCADAMKDLNNNAGPTAYDIDGNKLPLLKLATVEGGLTKRRVAPLEKTETYKDYKFFLAYKHDVGECRLPKEDLCKNAYRKLVASKCGSNDGIALNRMLFEASIDTGCGTFSWRVQAPPPPPAKLTLTTRGCHNAHPHKDVQKANVDIWNSYGCKLEPGKKIKAGDKDIYWHPISLAGGGIDGSNFKVSWVEGCTAAKEQSVEYPIEGDQSVNCGDLLKLNYYNCDNGGAGGSIDAGCVRYEFYAT